MKCQLTVKIGLEGEYGRFNCSKLITTGFVSFLIVMYSCCANYGLNTYLGNSDDKDKADCQINAVFEKCVLSALDLILCQLWDCL